MTRPRKATEPLAKTVSVRLPERVADRWRSEAVASGLSLGDWVRHRVDAEHARITRLPTPQRRPKALGRVSGVDPALLRQLAAIGSNVNQIARALNTVAPGNPLGGRIETLVTLRTIEQDLHAIADAAVTQNAHQVPAS